MRKVILVLAGVVVFAAGVAVGWFAARGTPPAPEAGDAGKPLLRFRAKDAGVLAAPPSWEEWKYPASRVDNSSTGGGHALGGLEFGAVQRVALVSADDFDEVWAFYKEKCRLRDPGDGTTTFRFEGGGDAREMTFTLFDDVQAHSFQGPKGEGLAARAFTVQSLRYTLVGFVYRPKGGDSTCVLLAYRPHNEVLGLLKEKLVKE